LVWGDVDFENEVFYTPLKSLENESSNFVNLHPKTHLKINNHVHSTIVKQLTKLIIISKPQTLINFKSISKCVVG
jgi:hypothetical protein